MSELKPCPFCGKKPTEHEPAKSGYWVGFWRITCECGAIMAGSHRGMNAETWNGRRLL